MSAATSAISNSLLSLFLSFPSEALSYALTLSLFMLWFEWYPYAMHGTSYSTIRFYPVFLGEPQLQLVGFGGKIDEDGGKLDC